MLVKYYLDNQAAVYYWEPSTRYQRFQLVELS